MTSTATIERPAPAATVPVVRSAARPARPVPLAPPARGGLRLTRRGRLVLVSLIALVVLAVALGGAASVSAVSSSQAPATTTVVVQPGQTLWQVASAVSPDSDPREVIAEITALNDLKTPLVAPGQALVVPA